MSIVRLFFVCLFLSLAVIYSSLGYSRVASHTSVAHQRGEHWITWDAGSQPSGVYFYRLEAGKENRRVDIRARGGGQPFRCAEGSCRKVRTCQQGVGVFF